MRTRRDCLADAPVSRLHGASRAVAASPVQLCVPRADPTPPHLPAAKSFLLPATRELD